jgi:hypothetical protein
LLHKNKDSRHYRNQHRLPSLDPAFAWLCPTADGRHRPCKLHRGVILRLGDPLRLTLENPLRARRVSQVLPLCCGHSFDVAIPWQYMNSTEALHLPVPNVCPITSNRGGLKETPYHETPRTKSSSSFFPTHVSKKGRKGYIISLPLSLWLS